MASGYPDFCCPQCKGALDFSGEEYSCRGCDRNYPVVIGIPDFRLFLPHSYVEDDFKKAKLLADQTDKLDFDRLVRFYHKTGPEISQDRLRRFSRRGSALVEMGFENLKEVEERLKRRHRNPMSFNAFLEIGCGSGGFLVSAKEKFKHIIGIDIALRSLVIARKRLDELGLEVSLICCCAEYLPFRSESFDLVIAGDVLEHVKDQASTLRECHRVLNREGVLFIATPNRFSIRPEPHVLVWGVGFLPRRWMNGYVKLVRGIPYHYERYKLLSFFELKTLLKKCSFRDHEILLPLITEAELKSFSTFEKIQVMIYDVIRKIPLIRSLLYVFGPFFHILGYANKGHERGNES